MADLIIAGMNILAWNVSLPIEDVWERSRLMGTGTEREEGLGKKEDGASTNTRKSCMATQKFRRRHAGTDPHRIITTQRESAFCLVYSFFRLSITARSPVSSSPFRTFKTKIQVNCILRALKH